MRERGGIRRHRCSVLNTGVGYGYERIDGPDPDGASGGVPDDVAVMRIHGATRSELFENAGAAMFSIGFDIAAIPSTYSRSLAVAGETMSDLLVNWLEGLLVLAGDERHVWSSFVVDRLEIGGARGSASGLPSHDVVQRGPLVVGVESRAVSLVPVPAGWWVDVTFATEPGLRLV